MQTRITRGAGRATRNSTDYTVVIMLGRELAAFCAEPAVHAACHPEIRATQAVDSAKAWQGFSRQGLIDQMTSSYGSKFTLAQAEYAASKVGL
jgi:hypothetical protein